MKRAYEVVTRTYSVTVVVGYVCLHLLCLCFPRDARGQELHWQPVADGLMVTLWHPPASCQDIPPLSIVNIDPDRYRFFVYHYREEGLSQPLTIQQWQDRTGHLFLFNAGLFRENYAYLGLLLKNGRSVGSKRHGTWQGLFVAEPVDKSLRKARVLDLAFDEFHEDEPGYREAAQSLMLLDRTGKVRVRQSGKRAYQTLVAEHGSGHVLVMKTTAPTSLYGLGQCLKESFPAVRQAMAMDGGSSSDMILSRSLRRDGILAEAKLPWAPMLDGSASQHVALPAVIGISPRPTESDKTRGPR